MAPLLAAARRMGLRVSGVSFHVGSGASNPDAFKEVRARPACDCAMETCGRVWLTLLPSCWKDI